MPLINVVIPFYQDKPGLLVAAVQSVLAQAEDSVLITVVDDGSPISAHKELQSFSGDPRVVVLEQPNGGPGAARNSGVANTPSDVEYIAFLDSDDRWLPGHIRNAVAALGTGADFYFADSDHGEKGQERSRFAAARFGPDGHTELRAGANLFLYHGDLADAVLRCSPFQTSSVVFRKSIAPDVLFPEGLRVGEDTIAFMHLALASRSVVFSTNCEVICGRGINIWAGATWGSADALRMILNTVKAHRLIERTFDLTVGQREWNRRWCGGLRDSFALNFLHRLRHRELIDWSSVYEFLRLDPLLSVAVLSALAKVVADRANIRVRT